MKKKTIAIAIASTVVSGTLITLPNVFANDMTSINQESQVMDEALESIRIQTFNYLSADELVNYDDVYKVPMENIKSITNNGGQYASSKITLAIDGDKSTHWETGKPNTDTFKNHFIVEFEEIEMINRLVYTVRQSGATGKGFPLQFEIYTSLTEDGDDFTLVGSAQTAQNNNAIEIKFQPTEFKRLKFVFVEAHNSWASAAELAFYSEDVLSDVINNVFVDGTHTQLAEEYQSLEKINEIEQLLVGHPLKDRYQKVIENARAIYENPDVFKNDLMITASQRGDASVEAREHQIPRTSYSLDSFGRYITPGETIEVYVDADEDGIYPKLVMGQIADDKNGWIRTYDLKPGYNQITAQEFDEMSPAILYVYNPALESQQAYAPIVRLVGGTDFPIYRHGETTPEEYEAALLAYMEKVSFDDEDFANGVRDDVYYNVTELVSENNTISTTAAGAIAAINEMNKTGYSVYDTMEQKEYVWQEVQRISGFDDEDENPSHHIFNQKFTTRVFTKGAFGWSASGYVGFNGGNTERRDTSHFKQIVLPFAPNLGWGYYHEWGHSINNSTIEHLEVTNNIYSAILHKHFGDGDRADWNYIYKRFSNEEISHGYFTYLAILLQLEYYYEDAYANASRIARENPDGVLNGLSSSLERLVVAYSIANGVDLTDFFEDWNYVSATDVMKEKVAH
ncbi:MAG TPA: hypothetical protein DCY20_08145, partial [Firmicutes bacterium]|nr:hypothetical protein [Bacillota bacterium]